MWFSPQLEFIFRTLVDMKIDLEDLRGEFDRFLLRGGGASGDGVAVSPAIREPIVIDATADRDPEAEDTIGDLAELEEDTLSFDPEMTMADLEREAIQYTLKAVGGKPAQSSGTPPDR